MAKSLGFLPFFYRCLKHTMRLEICYLHKIFIICNDVFREQFVKSIGDSFEIAPICALLGPRQCGKTTLSKHYVEKLKEPVHFFDLEDHLDIAKFRKS